MTDLEPYFAFLRERYRILLRRRAGDSPPWTDDPVLREWRFCNVRREDDRVTVWFRDNIREPLRDEYRVVFATVAFRWFNTISTGQLLAPYLVGDAGKWPRKEIERKLTAEAAAGRSIFTGAFMVNSRGGVPKHIDVLDNLDWCRKNLKLGDCRTKETAFKRLLSVPRLGNFAAYQVVVDLQYTYLLEGAEDFNTFTVAGPGCAKGINLLFFETPDWFSYSSKPHQEAMRIIMRNVLEASREPRHWPSEWPPFCLSDVENSFCEYAKYVSARAGARQKRRFRPSGISIP